MNNKTNELNATSNEQGVSQPVHKGVGGWLAFFCINLIILSPLFIILSRFVSFQKISNSTLLGPGLLTIFIVVSIIRGLVMILGIYTGISLWKIKPNAVRLVKRFLICSFICNIICLLLPFLTAFMLMAGITYVPSLSFLIGLPFTITEDTLKHLISNIVFLIIYFGIWFLYFSRSKRVRNTYIN